MKKVFGILVTVLLLAGLSACDKINNASRTMDTMLGGGIMRFIFRALINLST